MKVLFVTEQYCDGMPSRGKTNHFHNLFDTLRQSGMAEYDNLFIDDPGDHVSLKIADKINQYKPDYIFISYLGASSLNVNEYNLFCMNELGYKIIFLWPDINYEWAKQLVAMADEYAYKQVFWDGPKSTQQYTSKGIRTWVPQSEELFFPEEKTVEISFLGSTGSHYIDRGKYLQCLEDNRISVLVNGGQRERKLSIGSYASIMRATKIALNFSRSPEPSAHLHQLKGRVFEAMACGCLLLESDNPITSEFFTPMVDYVPFYSENDLIEKIAFYRANPAVLQSIAKNGLEKYRRDYSNKAFWAKVLS